MEHTVKAFDEDITRLRGLIAEMGGTLSHGAIIAREYGLPAIANVCNALQIIHTGEHLDLDAERGEVRRVQ